MKLFEPGKLGELSIKNRIVMAAMGVSGPFTELDGSLSRRGLDYYVARAKGGVGLIITGAIRVSRELERNVRRLRVDGISNDGAWLRSLADTMHDCGAKIALQMSVGSGRVGSPRHVSTPGGHYVGKSNVVAPSAVPGFWDSSTVTRELTIEEIRQLIESFKRPAEIIRLAGIDAVELNGHSGYLLDQFTTALWNKRADRYGGDLEGRLRLAVELIEAIKEGAGRDFPVIYKFGLTHYLPGGRDIDEGLEIARRLEAAGVDALDVDAGCYETHYWVHPSTYSPPGGTVHLAQMVKRVVSIPVMTVGKLGFPELAERILQEGKADFIVLGKALLADPEWPNKVKEKRLEDIRPCIGDLECLRRGRAGKYVSCTVNPASGKEREFAIRSARKKKSVLVVGGGPGGMEAAVVAALRGHRVTLWDKGNALGGNLIPASVPDFKQDYRSLVDYFSTQLKKLGVTIEVGKEATPELIREMKPDVVVIATGGTALIPEIPGVEKRNVITATNLLLGEGQVGESVVVLGGGLIGCETALYLAGKGSKVTIVARHGVASDVFWGSQMHLTKLLADAKMKILTDTRVLEIRDEGVIIADKHNNKSRLETNTVVLAIGLKPNQELWENLKGRLPEVHAIGDCVEPRRVVDAIWEAFRTARQI